MNHTPSESRLLPLWNVVSGLAGVVIRCMKLPEMPAIRVVLPALRSNRAPPACRPAPGQTCALNHKSGNCQSFAQSFFRVSKTLRKSRKPTCSLGLNRAPEGTDRIDAQIDACSVKLLDWAAGAF